MTMTHEEIVRHWRQAKRKDAKELQVLAELNSTGKDTIRMVLEGAGERVPKRRSKLKREDLPQNIELDCQKQTLEEAPSALPEVYGQIEAILAALPEGASATVGQRARDLLSGLFGEYLAERLCLREEEARRKPAPTE